MEITELQKQLKKDLGIVLYRGSDPLLHKERIAFDIPNLDLVLGGGLPRGRSYLTVGEFSSGKTFLAQMLIKSAQKVGGIAAYIDAEQTYDPEWFKLSGIDIEQLLVSQISIGEKVIDIVENLLRANLDLIVIDSLAAMIPTAEQDEKAEQQFMGIQARLINKAFRKWTNANSNSIIFAINQMRSGIGGYGIQEEYPGGKAQRFFSSVIFRTHRGGWITESKKRIGFDMEIFLTKSKICSPQQEIVIPFRFDICQLDIPSVLAQMCVDVGIIEQSGYTYSVLGKKAIGMNNLVELIKKENLEDQLKSLLQGEDGTSNR